MSVIQGQNSAQNTKTDPVTQVTSLCNFLSTYSLRENNPIYIQKYLIFGLFLQKNTNVSIVRRRFCKLDQTRSLPFQQSFFFFFYFFHVCHPFYIQKYLIFGPFLQKNTNVSIVRRRFCQPDQTRSLPFQQSFFFFFYFFHVCHPGTEFCTEYQDWSCDTAHCAILWNCREQKGHKILLWKQSPFIF